MRGIALFLTVLTGFSGLVYQVAWQKYLAALLGSHSEATAAVLGIFLGGLSYGYLLFGRISRRLAQNAPQGGARRRVVLAYGAVEAAIGLYALVFPLAFGLARTASLALPSAGSEITFALDVVITALLIGPPTILMGGTIPLLTQGLSLGLGDATRLHAWVYAFNTTGAFAGALCAAFLLIPLLGLEGSVRVMGVLNLAAGAAFLAIGRRLGPSAETAAPPPGAEARPAFAGLALAAGASGFAMMTLQTALNRIGGLALGASQFTFSMVVATFVLCIALGSFAVSALRQIPRAALPVSQWLLVAVLAALHPFVEDAPYWAHRLRILFGSASADFLPYHASVLGVTLCLLVVPLALSGALLPLIFHELRRETRDLGGVAGALYSANTLGSLLGALVGGYALFFWLDLDAIYRVAVATLAFAAALLSVGRLPGWSGAPRTAWAAFGTVVALLAMQDAWSPVKLSSGLFRVRAPFDFSYEGPDHLFELKRRDLGDDFVRFYRDDPVASIAVHEMVDGSLAIVNNGKIDGNIPGDNQTQGLLALLPALMAEGTGRAFVIGYGTGMTVGELTALDAFEEVVVAEISPAVFEAAAHFEPLNRNALASPKTRRVRSDAYRALLRSEGRFDVIVSEPSNPWVTGIEMLFSRDFLQAARARLAPGGVYAQWFQVYETDDETIRLALRTFLSAFDDVAVWHGEAADLIVLGFADGGGVDFERLQARAQRDDFRAQLADLELTNLPRLIAHELVPMGVLTPRALPGPVHTIESPILSDRAAHAFFRGAEGRLPTIAPTASSAQPLWQRYRERFAGGVPPDRDRLELLRETCRHSSLRCSTLFAEWLHDDPDSPALAASLDRARHHMRQLATALDGDLLRGLAALFEPGEPGAERARDDAWRRYFHHAAPFAGSGSELRLSGTRPR